MKPTLAYFALYRNRFKFYKIHDISSHEWKHYNDFLWNNFMCVILVFIWRPAGFGDFRAKTIGFHVTLRTRNSDAESGGDLFKGSKDAASLLVCTRKKLFGLGVQIFCEWRRKWRAFRPHWPTSPGPGLKPLDGSIWLKLLLEFQPQSESFVILDDLLGFRVQKFWSKVIKMFD